MAPNTEAKLIRCTQVSYGETFQAHLFDQYKHYVESAEKISERRVTASNYLLTVNVFLVTLYGLVASSRHNPYWIMLVPIAGMLVAVTWHRIITSYRDLNTIKFKVIHELEQHMPAALYEYEWSKAERGRGLAYRPLSHLERGIPLIFFLLYAVLALVGGLDLMPQKSVSPAIGTDPAATAPATTPPASASEVESYG